MAIRIWTLVEFEVNDTTGIYVDPNNLLNQVVKVKSGEYENLLMGTITRIISQKGELITSRKTKK